MNFKKESLFKQFSAEAIVDEKGSLIIMEAHNNIPIEIKRVYFMIPNDQQTPRGFHAHKKLRQYALCISGNCSLLFDNGFNKERYFLENRRTAIEIKPLVWHEIHDFSSDCILVVFADDVYRESDYIRDYDEFIRVVKQS